MVGLLSVKRPFVNSKFVRCGKRSRVVERKSGHITVELRCELPLSRAM